MNEFAINWLKGGEYAEITVPSGSALKSKKKAAGESEEALLEEMMDEMEDDSMEAENEDA